jgi:hypothetical protein
MHAAMQNRIAPAIPKYSIALPLLQKVAKLNRNQINAYPIVTLADGATEHCRITVPLVVYCAMKVRDTYLKHGMAGAASALPRVGLWIRRTYNAHVCL